MAEMTGILKAIKRAAVDAVEASCPAAVCFGSVVSESPLKILVDQKLTLGESQLILSRNVTDCKITVSGGNIGDFFYVGLCPEDGTEAVEPPHVHAVGTIEVTVHNALKTGERVLLLRQQGGQKYVVVDRI